MGQRRKTNNNNNQSGGRKSNFDNRRFDSQKSREKQNDGIFIYSGPISVAAMSEAINVTVGDIIKFLFLEGKNVTINSTLDEELVEIICINYGYESRREIKEDDFDKMDIVDDPKDLKPRPPIVTIMGHVDHGKTTLLDNIRASRVVEGEFGGITQAIGAYKVESKGRPICFLDTPGHEAFAAMRARGADVTDIIVLVVAADDGVMPQTKEAIDHAKLAKVPVIVAINKIDKIDSDPEKIKSQLTDLELVPEEWGGSTIYKEISAKMGKGVDELLENILVLAETLEVKANPARFAFGRVIEAGLDKGLGAVATLLVQNGTLNVGDPLVVGSVFGRVRNMYNDVGQVIKSAMPSTPVRITGLTDVPAAGDFFMAFPDERQAKLIADSRMQKKIALERDAGGVATNLDELMAGQSFDGQINVVIKADSHGSAEALKSAIQAIEIPGFKINVIRALSGAITESDILFALAGKAIVYGFNVRPHATIKQKADQEKVEIRLYKVIYQLVDDLTKELKGLQKPEMKEEVIGTAEVRQIFKVSKVGTIAGSFVTSGLIKSRSTIRLIRDGIVIFESKLSSLKRFKDEVKEVRTGFDCGITIENFNDIKEGDIIEAYENVEVKEG